MPTVGFGEGYNKREASRRAALRQTLKAKGLLPGSSTTRGTFWVVQGAAGVKDTVEVCAKDAADAYAWRTLY